MPDVDDDKVGADGLALMRCFLFELDDIARAKVLSYAKDLSLQRERRLDAAPGAAFDKH